MATPIYPPSNLDGEHVLRHSYDDDTQRLRVDIGSEINLDGSLEVNLDAENDSVSISDGENDLEINPDGSINVNVSGQASEEVVSLFDEILLVPTNTELEIVSYTVPVGKSFRLDLGNSSGLCDGTFYLKIDNDIQDIKRNSWTERNIEFKGPLEVPESSKISINVIHLRPDPHNFEGRIAGFLRNT